MHDGVPTLVFWGDATTEPTHSRTKTRDPLMQIHDPDLGKWHRLTPDHMRLACGPVAQLGRAGLRREQLAGPLCEECFTKFELELAAAHDTKGDY